MQTYINTVTVDKIGLLWWAINQIYRRSQKQSCYPDQDLNSIYPIWYESPHLKKQSPLACGGPVAFRLPITRDLALAI